MKKKDYTSRTAGIDTGKDKLDIAIHGSTQGCEVANEDSGFEQLIHWLGERKIERIGIESTGGYEKAVVAELRQAGFQVIVFQPKQVHCFAGFKLQRAKNDRIDAARVCPIDCVSFAAGDICFPASAS